MNGKDLFDGLNHIDERYIEEAENGRLTQHSLSPWLRAACLCLMIFGLWQLHPLFPRSPGSIPTTAPTDPILPEGFPTVIMYVEKMTDDGFVGTVTTAMSPELPQTGTKLHVLITEDSYYLTDDGRLESVLTAGIDFSGCCVMVEFREFDEAGTSIIANLISIEQKG